MRPFCIVLDEVLVEDGLHLPDGLEPGAAALGPEVLVAKCRVQPFDDAVPHPAHAAGRHLDALEPQLLLDLGRDPCAAANLAMFAADRA